MTEKWGELQGEFDLIRVKGSSRGQGSTVQLTPDNSKPRYLEPRANLNQNRFPWVSVIHLL